MKKFKLFISVIICFCFLLINSINCLACDLTHSENEDYNLYYDDYFATSCQGSEYENANCTKYLIRYDGLAPKMENIKKFIGEEDLTSRAKTLEKAGILTTGAAVLGTGMYFAPVTTVCTALGLSLSLPIVCIAHNEIVKPSGKALGYVFKSIVNVVEYFTGSNSSSSPDLGMVGNAIITMCGDSSKENPNEGLLEGIRKLIFGEKISDIKKSSKQVAYKELFDEFRKQVKKRNFEAKNFEGKSNNFLIFCMDSTDANNIKYNLKFDRTRLNIGDYPNKTEDYFKEWL